MVVLVSDLLDDPASVLDGLKHFRYRGTDVIVFHILDPYELKFPFEQAARFRDMETQEEVMAVPGSVRADYLERMQARIAFYRRELGLAGIDYCLLETSQPLELGLMAYLMTRAPSAVMFGISFLSPLFLIGAVAAAVPILLHLFHRKTEVVIDFPAVQLLTRAPVQQHRRRRLAGIAAARAARGGARPAGRVVREAVPRGRRGAGFGADHGDRGGYAR